MSSDAAAVPLSGEAFVLVMIVFVAGMLAVVLWRATTKARRARQGAPPPAPGAQRGQEGRSGPAVRDPGSTPGSDRGAG